MLEARQLQQATHPLRSGTDIRPLLNQFLPRRDTSVKAVLRQMELSARPLQIPRGSKGMMID